MIDVLSCCRWWSPRAQNVRILIEDVGEEAGREGREVQEGDEGELLLTYCGQLSHLYVTKNTQSQHLQ